LLLVNKLLHHHVTNAQQDLQDHQEAQEPQETLAPTEILVKAVGILPRDRLARKVLQGRQDLTEIRDHQEMQEHQLKAKKPDLDNQDPLEIQAHQDLLDPLAKQVNQELQDNQDQRDQMETQVP